MGGELRKVFEYTITSKRKRIAIIAILISLVSIKHNFSISTMYIYCPSIHQVNFRIISWILHSCGKNHVTASLCALLLPLKQTNKLIHVFLPPYYNILYNIPVTVICCNYSLGKKCSKCHRNLPLHHLNCEILKAPSLQL